MNTRWIRAATYMAASALAAGGLGAGAMGCEDPVEIGSGSSGGSDQAVGTTQTTSAELPSNNGGSDTTDNSQAQQQAPTQAQAQTGAPPATTDTTQSPSPSQSQAQAQPQPPPPQASVVSSTQQPQTAAPADTSAYGSLPMPNAETQVGSYSQSTTVYPGGTGPYVTDVSGAPAQTVNGNGSNVANRASAPNPQSPGANAAVYGSTPSNAAVPVGAQGTPNDVAAANRQSSQNVYNNTATQAPVTSQLRTAATVATPVQSPRSSR